MNSGGHQTGNMGHIHHHLGADAVTDMTDAFKVNHPGISGSAGHDDLWLTFNSQAFHLVIINALGLLIQTVGHHVVHFPGEIHFGAVG